MTLKILATSKKDTHTGDFVGEFVGKSVGETVGVFVGDSVGESVGNVASATVVLLASMTVKAIPLARLSHAIARLSP